MDKIILGKPSGITYEQHVKNVCDEGKSIVKNFPFVFEKYQKRVQKDLSKRLNGACLYHDTGKKHRRWQSACQKDYQLFLDWQKENSGDYKDFEKAVKGNTGPNLMKANIRHEIASLVMHRNDKFSLPVEVAIAAHHAKLTERHSEKWENTVFQGESKKYWIKLKKEGNRFSNFKFDFQSVLEKVYEYSGVRALLQLADHRASGKEAGDTSIIPFETLKFYYHFPKDWTLRPVQEIAKKHWEQNLLLLRAPTGAGKTDAALIWAQLQIQNGRADRLIFAMPTRFTSNALAISTAETLSQTGLYHSSAWQNKFGNITPSSENYKSAKNKHAYARLLLTPVTVCTIDHLLMSLTLTREDHHSIVFNLAHSCVVIDEADFYDDFTQANILVLLEALKLWSVPVVLMSASLPESSLKMYQEIGYDVTEIHEDNSDNERIRCNIKQIIDYEDVNELETILMNCLEKGNAIIYANTVDKAIAFYEWFSAKGIKPMIYHSRFTELDKKIKESILIENLGKKAWEGKRASGIAILTQIGEMSINISSEIMISDLCPIDRLMQRVGRLCRFDKKMGELYVINPKKDEKPYAYPYVINTQGEPVIAYNETEKLLECKGYSANDFVKFLNQVYPSFDGISSKSKSNADKLKELFVSNWLVGSVSTAKEDDTENEIWKSRDIDDNATIFVKNPETPYFKSWRDFQAFKVDNSIEIPRYMIERGLKNHKIHTDFKVKINEEKATPIYCLYPDVYSPNFGLILKRKIENDIEDKFL
jgi:CRISPR-associated endonuclease/helicase Cas3